jgi:hypothetical protein
MVMASAIVMEDVILKLVNELNSSFWSIDSLGAEVQYFAKKKSAQTNYMLFSIYAVLFVSSTIMFPIFGDHREWSVCEFAFDHYYAMLRFSGALLYTIEGLRLQIFLINQRILQVSDDHPDYDKLKVGQNILWQNKIFHTLLSCIKHHVIIVKYGDDKHS